MSFALDEQRGPAGQWVALHVRGCLDHQTSPRLRERLSELQRAGQRCVVVDLDGVEFLDSTGLGVLVGGLKRAQQAHGALHLVCTQPNVLKVFRITGLTKVFPIHDSTDSAVAAVAGAQVEGDDADQDRGDPAGGPPGTSEPGT